MKFLVVLCCVVVLACALPAPQEEEGPPQEDGENAGGDNAGGDENAGGGDAGDAPKPPGEDGGDAPKPPGDGGDAAGGDAAGDAPAEGGDAAKPPEDGNALPPEEGAEATTEAENMKKDVITLYCPTENPKIVAKLTMEKEELEQPPPNVVTDKYGSPLTDAFETEIQMPKWTVQIHSESWRTYYTLPPTKANCLCHTRGPLSRFKLIGNLHFKNIKINRRRFSTTDSASTECPPCNCADCFTTEAMTTKRKKLC